MSVRLNAGLSRFEAGTEDNPAHLDYRVSGSTMNIVHTEVPPEYQGQGLAGQLAATALGWARDQGHKVVPSCSYVAAYIAKRPEYSDLL